MLETGLPEKVDVKQDLVIGLIFTFIEHIVLCVHST